jgi:hypothetical protein
MYTGAGEHCGWSLTQVASTTRRTSDTSLVFNLHVTVAIGIKDEGKFANIPYVGRDVASSDVDSASYICRRHGFDVSRACKGIDHSTISGR